MKMKTVIPYLCVLGFSLYALAENKVILADDFKDQAAFEKRWKSHTAPGKSNYELDGTGLVVKVRHNPFNDGYIQCDIPIVRKGMLEFDMEFTDENNARGIGLFVDIYNVTTFFHSACRDWRYYFPEPEAKRLAGFDIEPVGHHKIADVSPKGRSHYCILFDADRDRVEFFKDDMSDPAAIVGNVSVLGRDCYLGGRLRIGSMGYTVGSPYSYRVMNLRLTEVADVVDVNAQRHGTLLFQGMTFDELRIYEALTCNGVKTEDCSRYTMESYSHAMVIANRLLYDKMPGERKLRNAELIVLADAPAGPNGIIPDFILKDMADFVRSGGRLVVFGGFFTLEKGEYQNTPLADVLPVELDSPYATGKFAQPTALGSRAQEYDWLGSERPFNVAYYHNLRVRKDAQVKLEADGKPILVEWQCGEGTVAVFLAMKAGRGELFTDNPQWFRLAAQICKGN